MSKVRPISSLTFGVDDILYGHWYAMKRPSRAYWHIIELLCPLQHQLWVEKGPALDVGIARLDPPEVRLGDLGDSESSRFELRGELSGCQETRLHGVRSMVFVALQPRLCQVDL